MPEFEAMGMQPALERARALQVRVHSTPVVTTLRSLPAGLTAREVEVLRLVAAGKSNPEIAAALVISPFTVLRHMNHIFAKTGTNNRVEAATFAHQHGLIG
jgi:DNA-binding CsgD family transcriptional regulator